MALKMKMQDPHLRGVDLSCLPSFLTKNARQTSALLVVERDTWREIVPTLDATIAVMPQPQRSTFDLREMRF